MYTNTGICLKHQVDISLTKSVVFLLPNKVRSACPIPLPLPPPPRYNLPLLRPLHTNKYRYVEYHYNLCRHHCWDCCWYSCGIISMVNVKLTPGTAKNCPLENMNLTIGKILAFHQTSNLAFFKWISSLSISLLSLNLVHSSQNPFFLPPSRITFPLVLIGFQPHSLTEINFVP